MVAEIGQSAAEKKSHSGMQSKLRNVIRVARGFIFEPKSQFWVNFWMVLQLKLSAYFMALWSVLHMYCHLVYFMVLWYILGLFGIFLPILVCCKKKNLATLFAARQQS
jgi:hypothetical protein